MTGGVCLPAKGPRLPPPPPSIGTVPGALNVDMIRQMTEMLTCQRSLQSAAQVTKMYDELMSHVSSDIGRM